MMMASCDGYNEQVVPEWVEEERRIHDAHHERPEVAEMKQESEYRMEKLRQKRPFLRSRELTV
jgi:hypothetical protein